MGFFDELQAIESAAKYFPAWAWDGYYDVVRRCNMILKDKTPPEIDEIALDVREILDENIDLIDDIVNDIWSKGEESITRFSIPRMLWLCVDIIDLETRESIGTPAWNEYFAVLALKRFMNFAEAVKRSSPETSQGSSKKQQWFFGSGIALADAVEAVTLAESLSTNPDSISQIKEELKAKLLQKQTERVRRAAVVRHEGTNTLLRDLVAFYDQGDFRSYRQAVVEFLEKTPEGRYKHLVPTNRLRTLAEGLSQVKRGKRTLS
ncbi:MAG: hypothetical protein ABW162_12130 [Candidatus Sedimenticola sp. PURPLELP]